MKVELKPGESVTVTLEGTDGEITVSFNETDVRVTADMADSSGRNGIIYLEHFALGPRCVHCTYTGNGDLYQICGRDDCTHAVDPEDEPESHLVRSEDLDAEPGPEDG